MKKKWLLFLVLAPLMAISQLPVKIFAYSQSELPGTILKGVTDENGNPLHIKKETPVNYYIFAAYPTSNNIIFKEIWLKGKFYSVETQKIDSTPVIKINNNVPDNPVKEVLVPYTRLNVISITPTTALNKTLKRCSKAGKLASKNELIVSCIYRGKKHFIGIKKIKVLEPVANL